VLYLVDANVLIDANRDYYPLDRVPEFWDWLQYQGEIGAGKIPLEIYEEITDGTGPRVDWLKRDEVRTALVLEEECIAAVVQLIISTGYASDLTDDELVKVGRDPFLVAYAKVADQDRCVVSTETSAPSKQRANRKVPDVCSNNGVQCCNTFEFIRRLDFSTRWRRPSA
jgi:hypothetical protein